MEHVAQGRMQFAAHVNVDVNVYPLWHSEQPMDVQTRQNCEHV